MSLFYQVNFTETRQSRNRKLWTTAWVFSALAVLLLGNHAKYLYDESRKPVLQPRLSRLQMYATRIEDCVAKWESTFAAYQEVRPYIEQRKRVSPLQASKVVTKIVATVMRHYEDSPLLIRPEKLSFQREEGFVLTLLVPLPAEDKKEHLKQVNDVLSNAVAQSVGIGLLPPAQITIVWEKESPEASDVTDRVTVEIIIPAKANMTFPKVPSDLTNAKKLLVPWRKRIRACSIKIPTSETKATVEEQLLCIPMPKGDEYASLRAMQQSFLDPLELTSKARTLLHAKFKTGDLLKKLDLFDAAWKDVALRCWKREKTLDNEELDALIAELALVTETLPKRDSFDTSMSKIKDYLDAFSKGILKKHIREITFRERVIDQSVAQATKNRFKATFIGQVDVNKAAPQIDFPVWRINLALVDSTGDPAKQKGVTAQMPISMLNNVLAAIETNSAGTWVTTFVASFVGSSEPKGDPGFKVGDISIEGRVPCWTKDTE